MPRFFAVDTNNHNEVLYFGAVDKDTGEWTERNDELLERVRQSIHERVTQKTNELLNLDPTIPVVLVGPDEQAVPR